MQENLQEQEKKRFEQDEKKERQEREEKLRKLEEITKLSHIKIDLNNLKELIMNWTIDIDVVDDLISWEEFDEETIEEIFEKIDEIEKIDDIDNLLPKQYRVTKEDYLLATKNINYKNTVVNKINQALDFIYMNSKWRSRWAKVFWSFLFLLAENLQTIQENYIDIKDNLTNNNK